MAHPFLYGEPLDLRNHADLFARSQVIATLCEYVDTRKFCLILGPKHSGRTTVLRALCEKRGVEQGCLTVYIHPVDLNLTSESRFFVSLSARIEQELRRECLWPVNIDRSSYQIEGNADGFNAFFDDLLGTLTVCLVLLFDAIERVPPNILTRFAHIAHALYSERPRNIAFNNLCVFFAGSLSLRHLTFQERPELSPFNICEEIVLSDLDPVEARKFLDSICRTHRLRFTYDAISAVVEHTGGDLDMLQRVASTALEHGQKRRDIDRRAVEYAVRVLIGESGQRPAEVLRLATVLVEEDPSTLDLVLAVLSNGSAAYHPNPVEDRLYNVFSVTYAEMAGVLALERPNGVPSVWRFRNRITEQFFRRFFTPQRIVKTYSALGQFDKAVENCAPLLKLVRERFEGDVVEFDDNDLKDVQIAFTNRIYQEGAHETAFRFLGRLLKEGFGYDDVTYYDYVPTQRVLREVKFLAHLFSNNGSEIKIDDPSSKNLIEVRVLESQLFAIETEQGITRIIIPLLNLIGDSTGVLIIRNASEPDRWATINIRVQIVQRALQAINVALNKVELDHKSRIADSLTLLKEKNQAADVFVAHKFNKELLTNLREHLGRVNDLLRFVYADDGRRVGALLEAIRAEIKASKLCLFEVSQPNNNVYFEIGLGIGLNKAGLMFSREFRGDRIAVPPVLAGISRISYTDYSSLLENLVGRVEHVLKQYLLQENSADHLHFAGVSVPTVRKLRPYAVILDTESFGDQNDYRNSIEEGLSKRAWKTIYPVGSDPLFADILVDGNGDGGPVHRICDWYNLIRNADAVIGRIEKTENDAVAGQAFIGLGIAFGLARQNVWLTHLKKDLSGSSVEIPADLRGMKCLSYDSLLDLKKLISRSVPKDESEPRDGPN